MPHSFKQIKTMVDDFNKFTASKVEKIKRIITEKFPNITEKFPILGKELPKRVPIPNDSTTEGLKIRQDFFREQGFKIEAITGFQKPVAPEQITGNIESQIGYASIPIGILGPMRINGANASGDFYVPMATTEGALLASYSRGAHIISLSGGATTICIADSVVRAPVFLFENLPHAIQFLNWILDQEERFKELASQTTRYGKLINIKATLNNCNVYLTFEYSTGDAAGQNMVTIATDYICRFIDDNSPIKPKKWFLDGNLSGDKKATMLSFLGNRGKKVLAEVIISKRTIQRFLHTTPEKMAEFAYLVQQGAAQSGGIGVQGHYANALASIYLACGQDVACVSESSIGMSTMRLTDNGDLYASVSLPNLIVGTVGGGTHLPTAKECLGIMDCIGVGKAKKFAEICAATVLAGELSISGAFCEGQFARAHSVHRHKS